MSKPQSPTPRRDEHGIPMCTEIECRAFDGRRCLLQGFRPDAVCAPALVADYRAAARVREAAGRVLRFGASTATMEQPLEDLAAALKGG